MIGYELEGGLQMIKGLLSADTVRTLSWYWIISDMSGVDSETQVNVYNPNGALVNSILTHGDTDVTLNGKGLYLIGIFTDSGLKTVKVVIH